MPSTLAYTNPEVLRWARESSGFSVQEAAKKIGIRWWQLEAAEGGSDYLTLPQAEKAAAAYERPLASLFLPSAPAEEPPEAQFRRLPGAPEPPWPPAMRLLARRVRERQEAADELYDLLDETPPWPEASRRFLSAQLSDLSQLSRRTLGVTKDEQFGWASDGASSAKYAALRGWIDAVEGLGLVVMQDGSLDLNVMRGFASVHSAVPAIVVNTGDDPRARAFTVVHELGHLLLALRDAELGQRAEGWCNDFAGEVLMPTEWLNEAFAASRTVEPVDRAEEISRAFGVTPLAAAVRVGRAGLLPPVDANQMIAAVRARWKGGERPAGGQYYRNTISQLGPAFIRLVFTALDSEAVTYPTASTLLGNVKVNNFASLRDHLAQRTEMA